MLYLNVITPAIIATAMMLMAHLNNHPAPRLRTAAMAVCYPCILVGSVTLLEQQPADARWLPILAILYSVAVSGAAIAIASRRHRWPAKAQRICIGTAIAATATITVLAVIQ